MVQFEKDVALALGDGQHRPERTAALGHDGLDSHIAAQGQAHGPVMKHVVVQEQRILPGPAPAAGQTADLDCLRVGEIQARQQVVGMNGVGIGEQDEMRLEAGLHPQPFLPDTRPAVGAGQHGVREPDRLHFHVGQHCPGQSQRRHLLGLMPLANDAFPGTAQQMHRAKLFQNRGLNGLAMRPVVGRNEKEQRIGTPAAKLGLHVMDDFRSGLGGVYLQTERRGPLHGCDIAGVHPCAKLHFGFAPFRTPLLLL